MSLLCCVDVGSTFTKAALVDTGSGELVATGSHRTTVGTDVLHGLDAAVAATGRAPDGLLVCSSAGGGLRLAVVGYERLVTAQAGHRVGLSAGSRVVHVAAGRLDRAGLAELRAARPDVVLLVGGTDGGDAETITHNATRLANARWRVPTVLAGNADCREQLAELLSGAGVPVVPVDNVLPAIGVLDPGPARAAIRQVFLQHVIGGKKLSRGPRFASLVRAATPDAVLSGVELLAARAGEDLLVVDVGGATTDVYSVLTPDAEQLAGVRDEVAGVMWAARTVEGDLGMRWSAPGVVAAAALEKIIGTDEAQVLELAAAARAEHPGYVADDGVERAVDQRLAELAVTVALRRHARGEAVVAGGPRRGGRDLRAVRTAIGSGGVLRHSPPHVAQAVLGAGLRDTAGGWALPRAARTVVDASYILAAAGLLSVEHPDAAAALLASELG
ncbi:glutamate mutase L [Catellatospora sichuanensis]|uniref:glutamate mutase L n=1 Tax=Catellatospora sichuanensis TaxID=1969805 RepID=UPI001183020C|nr:glutamate mutase L [Catellatospora sichuanensis]